MITMKIEVTGQFRSGKAKAPPHNPYFFGEAFAHLPGVPYPQKFNFYASTREEIPQPGTYECDVVCSIKDDRINFEVDPRQGRRISSPVAAATPARAAS